MRRLIRDLSIVTGVAVVLGTGSAWAAGTGEIREAVKERYRPSRIELQATDQRGMVTKPGTVLTLLADGVPANVLRVSKPERPHPKIQAPPRVRHIENYARVMVDASGNLADAPGELTLAAGTRLVVFDVKVERDHLRLFTHTAEPVARPDGGPAYGCTEFVFPLAAGASVSEVLGSIDRVLTVQAR
jgi:hypothetical protein